MAKFSAPIQLAPIPGHGSQQLFFLFPITTSLFLHVFIVIYYYITKYKVSAFPHL